MNNRGRALRPWPRRRSRCEAEYVSGDSYDVLARIAEAGRRSRDVLNRAACDVVRPASESRAVARRAARESEHLGNALAGTGPKMDLGTRTSGDECDEHRGHATA